MRVASRAESESCTDGEDEVFGMDRWYCSSFTRFESRGLPVADGRRPRAISY